MWDGFVQYGTFLRKGKSHADCYEHAKKQLAEAATRAAIEAGAEAEACPRPLPVVELHSFLNSSSRSSIDALNLSTMIITWIFARRERIVSVSTAEPRLAKELSAR